MANEAAAHDFTPTEKTRVKRLHERGHYDRETVYAILDAGFICHVGYLIDDQPYVTPTSYWREGDRVYWHGSSASRMLRTISKGIKVCLTVTHVDGLVLARSGFHSSINYRAVMAFGKAEVITDAQHKEQALKAFVEQVTPGRWATLRPVTSQELKGTTVLSMKLSEVSAKVRTGPPKDDEEDYALPIWAGVLPLKMTSGPPEPDPRLTADVPIPEHARRFALER
ncbi:MAG TPA: pyridoxamine 5'-phosphate oxidase family protein [Stellaceae bacterium]|nr:pyridoxamine 5'-phosphate oxidase family protein [Stellaceae bacterium]